MPETVQQRTTKDEEPGGAAEITGVVQFVKDAGTGLQSKIV